MATSKIPTLARTDDIQSPTTIWKSTICFRKFRRKLSELSRMHWTSSLGAHYISQKNALISASDKLTLTESGLPFRSNMLALSRKEMQDWLPEYENTIRNSILLLCSGNIEHYLKRSILLYLLASGYAKPTDKFKLNDVGDAIGYPVIQKSTIPAQLAYIEHLLDVDFKKHVSVWSNAYKERCTLAHQAGIISNTNKDSILQYDENVQTDWAALLQVMDSSSQIVSIIDQRISTPAVRLLELEFELCTLKLAKKLPKREDLWTYIHKELGCNNTAKESKQRIEAMLY